jgi:hypothetical protein
MPVNELFEQIESAAFAARANIANTFRSFIRALAIDSAQRGLYLLASEAANAEHVFSRVENLLRHDSELTFENPHDTALAAYLHILFYARSELTLQAAKLIADAPRLWWAEMVARIILQNQQMIALSSSHVKTESLASPAAPTTKQLLPGEGVSFFSLTPNVVELSTADWKQ